MKKDSGYKVYLICFLLGNSPASEFGTECSETSAYKVQASGNYPEESILHSEQGESLKSGNVYLYVIVTIHPLFPPLMPDIILSVLFANIYSLYFAAVTSRLVCKHAWDKKLNSIAAVAGSNSAEDLHVCLMYSLCRYCVGMYRPLRRVDHWYRGVLLGVWVQMCMIYKPQQWGATKTKILDDGP
jgi:hypothetical protein